jgi:uncharacterized protein (TIGR02145 family)
MKTKYVSAIAFTAAIVLATALTLSCSDDSSKGGGDSSGSTAEPIRKAKISGVFQKGPFVEGSKATLYELNESLEQTGRSFTDIIADSKGSFEIKNVELVSPYAMLEASGYYRNENTGDISKSPITLFAIADIREKDNINVNILTHLEYHRVLDLAKNDGSKLKDAKKQAQREIFAVFGIDGDSFKDSEDMSIFGTSESDAALLAISVLLQGDLSEGVFSQRLTNFAQSLKASGVWNNETDKNKMADWAASADLGSIKNNILSWNLSSAVPDFEKFANDYWHVNYGLGDCDAGLRNNIKNSNRSVNYICKNNAWAVATEYELDTYQWVCIEGEIKAGQESGKIYSCKNNTWAEARYIEIKCFESKSCQTFRDDRDGRFYYYVKIGEQTWMAENLNYAIAGSKCVSDIKNEGGYYELIDENTVRCDEYGRIYNWATAMSVCPSGWHLPSNAEWDKLLRYADGTSGTESPYKSKTAGKYLKATSGWVYASMSGNGNGSDDYGFAALPSSRIVVGYAYIFWWSSSSDDSGGDLDAYVMGLGYNPNTEYGTTGEASLNYVRCLMN